MTSRINDWTSATLWRQVYDKAEGLRLKHLVQVGRVQVFVDVRPDAGLIGRGIDARVVVSHDTRPRSIQFGVTTWKRMSA